MNVLKSILEGQIPLSKELAEWVYECSECGNCSEVCHMSQNEHIILPTCQWIDHVKVWDALRKDLVETGLAPIERHSQLVEYMINDSMRKITKSINNNARFPVAGNHHSWPHREGHFWGC